MSRYKDFTRHFEQWSTQNYGLDAFNLMLEATRRESESGVVSFLFVHRGGVCEAVVGRETAEEMESHYDGLAVELDTFDSEQMLLIETYQATAYDIAGFIDMIEHMRDRLTGRLQET